MNEYKKGDWVFCEFELSQIKEVDDNANITDVSNGSIRTGGRDLNSKCYPLDLKVKVLSEHVKDWSDRLHDLECNSLNYPDIHKKLVQKWCEMCDNREDQDKMREKMNELDEFCRTIVDKVNNELRQEEVGDVKLFK